MNSALPISVINQWTSSKAAPAEKEKKSELHKFVKYDPKADLCSNQNRCLFWKIANVINIIVCIVFQLIADYFTLITAPFYLPLVVLLGVGITYAGYSAFKTKIDAYAAQVKRAQALVSKMNKIKDEEIPNKLQAIGLDPKDVHSSLKTEKIKQILADYEVKMDLVEDSSAVLLENQIKMDLQEDCAKLNQIRNKDPLDPTGLIFAKKYAELKWNQGKYKTPFDLKHVYIERNKITLKPPGEKGAEIDISPALLHHLYRNNWLNIQTYRVEFQALKETIAWAKMKAVYSLKILQNPFEKPFSHLVKYDSPNSGLSLARIIAARYGEEEADVVMVTNAQNDNNNASRKYTARQILDKTPAQLGAEIFGLKIHEQTIASGGEK